MFYKSGNNKKQETMYQNLSDKEFLQLIFNSEGRLGMDYVEEAKITSPLSMYTFFVNIKYCFACFQIGIIIGFLYSMIVFWIRDIHHFDRG
jgi:hypothetical protein